MSQSCPLFPLKYNMLTAFLKKAALDNIELILRIQIEKHYTLQTDHLHVVKQSI